MDSNFSRRNRKRCEAPNGFNHKLDSWSASDWLIAMMGEFGEACNVQKKLNRVRDGIPGNKEGVDVLKAKLAQELADGYIYLDLFCQSKGIDLRSWVNVVFNLKSQQIGYKEDE